MRVLIVKLNSDMDIVRTIHLNNILKFSDYSETEMVILQKQQLIKSSTVATNNLKIEENDLLLPLPTFTCFLKTEIFDKNL